MLKTVSSIVNAIGALNYKGTWNANTNTPTLVSSVGNKGDYYVVNVAGTTNLNGITDWQVNDWAIFNGSVWEKVDNTDLVTSVNGQTGAVIVTESVRVVTIADGISITVNSDTTDIAYQANTQAAGNLDINAPTGTPVNGQKFMIKLKSTNQQTFVFNAIFDGSNDLGLPSLSTGSDKYDYMGFIYNSASSKWELIAKNFGF